MTTWQRAGREEQRVRRTGRRGGYFREMRVVPRDDRNAIAAVLRSSGNGPLAGAVLSSTTPIAQVTRVWDLIVANAPAAPAAGRRSGSPGVRADARTSAPPSSAAAADAAPPTPPTTSTHPRRRSPPNQWRTVPMQQNGLNISPPLRPTQSPSRRDAPRGNNRRAGSPSGPRKELTEEGADRGRS